MNVYFCSDLHLGHKLASTLRGFDSIAEHDEHIIQELQKVCHKRTVLWILGDVAMSQASFKELWRLEGRLILVRGNHDVLPEELYRNRFEKIHGIIRYKQMWLTHCPIHPQEMYRCKANLHGHIHKNTNSPELPLPYININWDFWKRPLSLDEIKTLRDQEV